VVVEGDNFPVLAGPGPAGVGVKQGVAAGIISVQVLPISPANADVGLPSIVIRGEWHLAGCCPDSGWMGPWVVVAGRGRE